jgi:uncharacterized protein (TIGR02996 family)
MTTEDDFQAALDANPADWQTRLVFADWLQERGDPRADGYRALGQLRRMPTPLKSGWRLRWNMDDEWFQFLPQESSRFKSQSADTLPRSWMALIRGAKSRGGFRFETKTRREAEGAAALAFAQLGVEFRAELIATPPPAKKPATKKPTARKKPKGKKK